MDSLQHVRASFQDHRSSTLISNSAGFPTADIELGNSSLLNVPEIRRRPSPALSDVSFHTQSVYTEPDSPNLDLPPLEHGHSRGINGKLRAFWQRNWGLVFVCFAQFFGNVMNTSARLLEEDSPDRKGMHPFQILFDRMIISGTVSTVYMWYVKTPEFPFGQKYMRPVLVIRGFAGFFGVGGMFMSLQYLPLSDATVISFLAPPLACLACSYILKEPFTRIEQIATMISLCGVILIAQPTAMFRTGTGNTATLPASGNGDVTHGAGSPTPEKITPQQRLLAVGFCLVGVLGGASQLVCLRWIGPRAHPLISVNYLNFIVAAITGTLCSFLPGLGFAIPSTITDWICLSALSASGIILQCFLALGLGAEKSSRATNMAYSQMLFAVVADLVIWGTVPSVLSVVGSTLILGSAIYVALQKDAVQSNIPNSKEVEYIQLNGDVEQQSLSDDEDAEES